MVQFLQWMGFGLCHQLPERSFFGGGVQVPVCARDTGIYIGFVVSVLVISLLHRDERPRGFPKPIVWAAMAVFLVAMGWDGVSSYAGWRPTTNELRLITGLGMGFSVGAVIFPMLQDELWIRSSPARILEPLWRFGVWLAAIPVTYAVVWWVGPAIGIVYPLLVAVAIIVTLTMTNLVIVAMFPAFDRRLERMNQLFVPVLIAMALSFGEIAAASALRTFLERL